MIFKNMNDLLNCVEKDMQKVLENEVTETVKDNLIDTTNTSVYGVYSPKYYTRRMDKNGLIDRGNIEANVSGNVLTVHNNTPLDNGRSDYALDEIIVYGKGKQPFARDFYGDTVARLENNGEHVEAMKNGLRKRGYKVKWRITIIYFRNIPMLWV